MHSELFQRYKMDSKIRIHVSIKQYSQHGPKSGVLVFLYNASKTIHYEILRILYF